MVEKATYTKQVYALYLKKVEAAVVQAESTATADDVNQAISIWTATDPYPFPLKFEGFDAALYDYISELRSALSARISAIQVGSKVAPTPQEQDSQQYASEYSQPNTQDVSQGVGQQYSAPSYTAPAAPATQSGASAPIQERYSNMYEYLQSLPGSEDFIDNPDNPIMDHSFSGR